MTLVACISQTRHIAVLCKLGKLVSFADCSLSCALMQDWHSYLTKIQSLFITFEIIECEKSHSAFTRPILKKW